MARVKVDFFTLDEAHEEYVMYLVEEGPWLPDDMPLRLSALQERIYSAVDVAIDGHLGKEHPESMGMKVRIQVDLHDDAPPDIETLVRRLSDHIAKNPEYLADVAKSPYLRGLRVVVKRPGEGRPS